MKNRKPLAEYGVLYNGQMVRALLEGRKTQTRRPVTPQPTMPDPDPGVYPDMYNRNPQEWAFWLPDGRMTEPRTWRPPHGVAGDTHWVRETWRYADWTHDGYPWIEYRADGTMEVREPDEDWAERVVDVWAELSANMLNGCACDRRWRPSIHMPRWASRLSRVVKSMRIERLIHITDVDARAEGVKPGQTTDGDMSYALGFVDTWDIVYGEKYPAESNPWVWVYEY